jgi:hypothetical protein
MVATARLVLLAASLLLGAVASAHKSSSSSRGSSTPSPYVSLSSALPREMSLLINRLPQNERQQRFPNAVATDPRPDGFTLWCADIRLSFTAQPRRSEPLQTHRSQLVVPPGTTGPLSVRWWVAEDQKLRHVVKEGQVEASPSTLWVLQVRCNGRCSSFHTIQHDRPITPFSSRPP